MNFYFLFLLKIFVQPSETFGSKSLLNDIGVKGDRGRGRWRERGEREAEGGGQIGERERQG